MERFMKLNFRMVNVISSDSRATSFNTFDWYLLSEERLFIMIS